MKRPLRSTVTFLFFITTFFSVVTPGYGQNRRRDLGGTTVSTVKFGSATAQCSGRGVCNSTRSNSPGTTTTFFCDKTGTVFTIALDIDMDTAASNQPLQAYYWRGGPSTYTFDYPFDISTSETGIAYEDTFKLPLGTIIPALTPFPVKYSQSHGHTIATMTITPVTPRTQTLQVMFGGGAGASPAITQTAAQSFTVAVNNPGNPSVATSIPVTFSLAPGHAEQLLMVFKVNDLASYQPLARSLFNPGQPQWQMTFCLSSVAPQLWTNGGIGLPQNVFFVFPMVRISQSQDGKWDSCFVPYYISEPPTLLFAQEISSNNVIISWPNNVQNAMNYNMAIYYYSGSDTTGVGGVGSVTNDGYTACQTQFTTPLDATKNYFARIQSATADGCGMSYTMPNYYFTVPANGGGAEYLRNKKKKVKK